MGEWSANNQARATAVWDKLLGFYGDSLLRRFGAEPPAEWAEAIGMLADAQVTRGIRRLMFGAGAKGVPSLPEFMRVCRVLGDDAPDEGPRPIALPALPTGNFDGWAMTANNRFMKYVMHRIQENTRAWGSGGSTQQAENTRIAVAYKNAWAQDMREACTVDSNGEILMPPQEEQDRQWVACMARAEADILATMQRMAA
jgi:hypothetical protein